MALIWLLMLAVPAQGLAAATMMHCGAGGGSETFPFAQAGHEQPQNGSNQFSHAHLATVAKAHDHAHPDMGSAAHDHAAHSAHNGSGKAPFHIEVADAGSDFHLPQLDLASDTDGDPTQTKCSACANCCSAAVIPPSALTLSGMTLPTLTLRSEFPSRPSFITDGPQRPPRPLLA